MTEQKKPIAEGGHCCQPSPDGAAQEGFTKRDTATVKCVAICMLLFHHLYMGVLPAPMSLTGNHPGLVIATLSKVCVAMFTLLSGYGLAVSYSRRRSGVYEFQKKHILGLLKPFWLVYAVFFIASTVIGRAEFTPSAVYGTGLAGIKGVLLDFLCLRPLFGTASLNQTWWYMEAALVMYLLFPVLHFLVKKVPYIILPLTAVPLVVYTVWGKNVWDTCREIYWFFPFVCGIFLADRNFPDRFARACRTHGVAAFFGSLGAVLVCTFVRAKLGLVADTFYATAIILFLRASVCRVPVLQSIAVFIGKRSADIFMTHSFFYCYFVTQTYFTRLFLWQQSPWLQLLAMPVLLAVSLAAAVVLDCARNVLSQGTLLGRPRGIRRNVPQPEG